jgi:hypothetical protein
MTVRLCDIWPISAPQSFKLHFARSDGQKQPLEVWVRDKWEWQEWQEYRPGRDEFNRPFIFSLMRFYHEPDIWLFGGVFSVLQRYIDRYEVALSDDGAGFIGRLKLHSSYRDRTTRDLSFEELETLVRNSRPDWMAALAKVKGIYLISDISTGKRYVGSAYGEEGIWSRWCSYVATGHGGNIELRALVSDPTLEYCRKSFRFALLEYRPSSTPDEVIIEREGYWKSILLTRGEHGLNRN